MPAGGLQWTRCCPSFSGGAAGGVRRPQEVRWVTTRGSVRVSRFLPLPLVSAYRTDRCSRRTEDAAAVPVARSVLVDMEPKVIWQVVERAMRSREPGRWCYQPGGSFAQSSGAGNNWAYGFAVHGPAASDTVMELVRSVSFYPHKLIFSHSFSHAKLTKSSRQTGAQGGRAVRPARRAHAAAEPGWRHRVRVLFSD